MRLPDGMFRVTFPEVRTIAAFEVRWNAQQLQGPEWFLSRFEDALAVLKERDYERWRRFQANVTRIALVPEAGTLTAWFPQFECLEFGAREVERQAEQWKVDGVLLIANELASGAALARRARLGIRLDSPKKIGRFSRLVLREQVRFARRVGDWPLSEFVRRCGLALDEAELASGGTLDLRQEGIVDQLREMGWPAWAIWLTRLWVQVLNWWRR